MKMNLKNLEPELLPIDKLPYLKFQQENIERCNNIINHLNIRKKMLREIIEVNKDSLDYQIQYDNNERELLLIKTEIELAKTHTDKIKRTDHFNEIKKDMCKVLIEMESEWQNLIVKAEDKKGKNVKIQEMLDKLDMPKFDENWEYAIDFYLNLKHLIYPSEKQKEGMKKV